MKKPKEKRKSDEQMDLKFFSFKLDFDGTLTPGVLKNAAEGIEWMLESSTQLFSAVTGEELALQQIGIGRVEAGSCGFQDIALLFKEIKGILKEAKDMPAKNLFIVCLTLCTLLATKEFAAYKTAELAQSGSGEGNIVIKDNDLTIRDSLIQLFPTLNKETAAKLVETGLELVEKDPKIMRKFKKGLVTATHPGGVETKGILAGINEMPGEEAKDLVPIIDEEGVKKLPDKMPAEPKKEQEKEYLRNVQIEVTKIDKESAADNAILCRIVDEEYSQKKVPLIIHDEELKAEIMRRFPKNANVNLYMLSQEGKQGERRIVGYVLDKIID